VPYVQSCLAGRAGPFVAATDYMRIVADQVREWVPGRYHVLGTDGFGRSDSRAALRDFFEVDRRWIAVAALKALADEGRLDAATVKSAMERFGIDRDKPNPVTA
jgi:pyruvate dehydrogenase E1 component